MPKTKRNKTSSNKVKPPVLKNGVQPNNMELKQVIRSEVRAELYQGLVPHPDIIAKFEKLYPGAAAFFFEEVQKQTDHRIFMEKRALDSNVESEKRGSIFAFIITMTALTGGFGLIILGFEVVGVIAAVGGLSALVGVFITGKIISVRQLRHKREN
jgi:uncharacterized membrane protein